MEVRWYHIYGRYPQFRFLKWPSMEVKDPQIMPRMPSKVKSEKQRIEEECYTGKNKKNMGFSTESNYAHI